MRGMRRTHTVDLRDVVMWGLQGNSWRMACNNLKTIKPYDGDSLVVEMKMTETEFRSFNSYVAYELHHINRGTRPDVYNLETRIATFTGVDMLDSATAKIAERKKTYSMMVRLYRQHVSFLQQV